MILKLLEFGADTTISDEEEKLPLHHAAEYVKALTLSLRFILMQTIFHT